MGIYLHLIFLSSGERCEVISIGPSVVPFGIKNSEEIEKQLNIKVHHILLQRRYIEASIREWKHAKMINYVVYANKVDKEKNQVSLKILSQNKSIFIVVYIFYSL